MKRTFAKVVCALLAAAAASAYGGVAYTTPTRISFCLDTRAAYPVVSRVAPVALPYADGATITATAPDGISTTLPAAVDGTNYWTATAGGVWALENSNEGTAMFAVRYVPAEQGAGTEASPYKLVDNDELSGVSVSDGFIVALEGPLASIGDMARPSGFVIMALGGDKYRFDETSGGAVFVAQRRTYPMDTVQEGPDRRILSWDQSLPVAYSGDDWAFSPSAESTLTFTSPTGAVTAVAQTGTGAYEPDFPIRGNGEWTIVLSGGGVTTLTAHINLTGQGFILIVR